MKLFDTNYFRDISLYSLDYEILETHKIIFVIINSQIYVVQKMLIA